MTVKTSEQVALMRQAGVVVAQALHQAAALAQPGVTTAELSEVAEQVMLTAGAKPAFKGYQGFPAALCVSINEEIVHGIPGKRRLQEGDLVSLDAGAIVQGWYADSAITVGVGAVAAQHHRLIQVCEQALQAGIAVAQPGRTVADISQAVASSVHANGPYGVLRDYTGHGIGRRLHEEPDVPNHLPTGVRGTWVRRRSPRLEVGMVLAIEPMITLTTTRHDGLADGIEQDDGWTVVSSDGSWGAHAEHTVAITAQGPVVLTALPELQEAG